MRLQPCAGSLLLATAWHPDSFTAISSASSQRFRLQPMAGALLLQRPDAHQLVQLEMQNSRQKAAAAQAAGRHAESAVQLDQQLAVSIADQLAFATDPMYVPKVLSVFARILGREADPGNIMPLLQDMQQQLQDAEQPTGDQDTLAAGEDAIFGQLSVCFRQLGGTAQQVFLDLHVALQQHKHWSLNAVALQLCSQQQRLCKMETMREKVRNTYAVLPCTLLSGKRLKLQFLPVV